MLRYHGGVFIPGSLSSSEPCLYLLIHRDSVCNLKIGEATKENFVNFFCPFFFNMKNTFIVHSFLFQASLLLFM